MPTTHTIPDPFQTLIRSLDPQAADIRMRPLTGGVSAQVSAVSYTSAGGEQFTVVVRQHGAADVAHNPHIARDEFTLLRLLKAAGVPVPAPYLADESGTVLPTPYIVTEFITGETLLGSHDPQPLVTQAALHLARLHRIAWPLHELAFLPTPPQLDAGRFSQPPAALDDSIQERQIRAVLESVWPLTARNRAALLHGDYWPGNWLWRDGQLISILDWEDAHTGDPLEDLANSRLEILWAFGVDAMHQFTSAYRHENALDDAHLPYWDLSAALRPAFKLSAWAANAAAERLMRDRHAFFVQQAIASIPSKPKG